MRIMLIDDSKTMRNIQKSVLSGLGYTEIEEACDGQDALSKVGAFKPPICAWSTGTCPSWTA
jgi:two-component system chemotaxis response regulator CheY